MPAAKKPTDRKKPSKKTAAKTTQKPTKNIKKSASKSENATKKASLKQVFVHLGGDIKTIVRKIVKREKGFLRRRPHRSFRLTRRRDYRRSLDIPGYWSFTNSVRALLWKNKKLFGGLALVYIVASIVISGFSGQETYSSLVQSLKDAGGGLFEGDLGGVGKASLLLTASITSGLTPDVTQAQTVMASLAVFFAWLVTIWLVRQVMAGNKPKIRDGLYNAGSPILSTILMGFLVIIQLIPLAVAVIIYSAADTSGLLEGGVSAMLVWSAVVLLAILSVYWLSSSIMAMVIIALPGMYPMRAIKVAGDVVVGRRMRMLFRYLWLAVIVVVLWAVIMIPVILFDDWLKGFVPSLNWLPLVPFLIVAMAAFTIIFATTYIYMLYRRVMDAESTSK
ncbi:hypothetical protein KC949_02060 [Candidatus Saccharibacteria bacterium]|jgi:hypothetical protein|nr:hypothetical protein [Candidatus Saccharibacteria bacterium]